ncbi:Predicted oxidoreductase [Paenibacillus sp. UNC496MF]|uniref:aldo/keto reductase n=1 Tax=Paenibacillus sp. UNC496MF TaxID=1502753 RepID=UPI0008DEAF65|nr:aldo/keto reductase [Paenibacillus sp. UNC496MF]SFJ82538.1 Predicted oxidoreductase [Paenibacillus sp. UNC496MF]
MKYAKLGRTDMEVSRITYGAMELGGGNAFSGGLTRWELRPEEDNIRLLRRAFENGVNSFDTAELYGAGLSEILVGKALSEVRKQCVIATKVSAHHLRPKEIRTALWQSMFRLNTDYIDLYYIHTPSNEIPIEESMGELSKLKEEGVIRAIGVSNFSLAQLKKAMQYGRIDAIQPEYHMLQRSIEDDLLGYCLENDISIMSYNSLAKGILTGIFHKGKEVTDFRKERPLFQSENLLKTADLIRLLEEIAAAKDATLSQIAISWLLRQKGLTSAIVGTQNEKHFFENLQSIDTELTDEQATKLDAVSKQTLRNLA